MDKKKKRTLITLIIIAIIAGGIFGYTKYLNGDFNEILEKNEATKDLVVVDLDVENHEDQKGIRYELDNGIETEYYYTDDGKIDIAHIEAEVDSSKFDSKLLIAAKTATKAVKGVKFEYEEENGKIDIDLTIAPNDINVELLDKLSDFNILSKEEVNQYKDILQNLTAEDINKVLSNLDY